MTELKTILKDRRDELGLSQDKLGRLIGTNDAFISRIEHGKEISIDALSKLSKELKVDLIDLLIESGYISSESLKKHELMQWQESAYLNEQDCDYIRSFIDSLISKRKSEAGQ
ncbi:hypothetical protein SDC9_163683 [bioreactor metagenome]|uniref:HTH cro/C1-type domain-containing protein n=1 Tax=bioreactor metagenome TaxID=1076179 RepID=A0A645FWF5_9ZZZZ